MQATEGQEGSHRSLQLDIATAKNVLQLIINDEFATEGLRNRMFKEAAAAILGKAEGVSTSGNLEATARDLLRIAEAREPAQSLPKPLASESLPDEEAVKDRISRVFMSSPAFKICFGVLAVGTALFGVNLGFLTFSADAVNKTKVDAMNAVNAAKAQADNAKNAVEAAVAEARQTVVAKTVEKIDVDETRQRVVTLLGQKFDRDLQERTDKVVKDLQERAATLKAATDKLPAEFQTLREQAATLKTANDKLPVEFQERTNKLAKDLQDQTTTLKANNEVNKAEVAASKDEQQKLLKRWQDAVDSAQRTAADQTVAAAVWKILQWDAWLLFGGLCLSALAFVLAGLAAWKIFRLRARLVPEDGA